MRYLTILVILFISACRAGDAPVPQSSYDNTVEAHAIPEDVQITVIDESTVQNAKRSLDVRISRRVTESELRLIAEELRSRDPNSYDRTFIIYYLPGMTPGAGGWATSHFNPNLDVRILGTTVEQEQDLASAEAPTPGRDVIGRWAGDQPYMPARIMLYREEGNLLMLRTYADGSGSPMEVTEAPTSNGTRYEWSGSGGGYVLVTSAGTLEMRDADGLIASYRPED